MALGALPRPSRVPEQRLLSPEIHRRRRRSCGTLSGNLPIPLGFYVGRLLIGEGASSGGDQGGLTIGGHGQGLDHAPPVVWEAPGPSPAPLRTSGSFGKFLDVRLLFRPIPRIFPV
jgi:hypothetical protein